METNCHLGWHIHFSCGQYHGTLWSQEILQLVQATVVFPQLFFWKCAHCASQGLLPVQNAQPQSQAEQGRLPVKRDLRETRAIRPIQSQFCCKVSARGISAVVTDHNETSCYLEQSHRPPLSPAAILQLLQAAKFCLQLIFVQCLPCANLSLLPVWIGRPRGEEQWGGVSLSMGHLVTNYLMGRGSSL